MSGSCCSGCADGGLDPSTGGASDHKVKVTNADTTPDFLNPKILAGAGITTTVVNPGANEQLRIDATAVAGDPLNFAYYADNLATTVDETGAINAPFHSLQDAIDAIIANSGGVGGSVILSPSGVSYGNVTLTLTAESIKITSLGCFDGTNQSTIGSVILNSSQNCGVYFENLNVGDVTDISAAMTNQLTFVNSSYTSLVGDDFNVLNISNDVPMNVQGTALCPGAGVTSAVNNASIENGFLTATIDSISGGFAKNTKFTSFPTCSINVWTLYDSDFATSGSTVVGAEIDSVTEKNAMIAGLLMDALGVAGLDLQQNDCVGMTDADQSLDFSAATRMVADQQAVTVDRNVDFQNTSGKDGQLFFYDDWHTAHNITFSFNGGPTLTTAGPNSPGEGFRYTFMRSQAALNPVVYLYCSEL